MAEERQADPTETAADPAATDEGKAPDGFGSAFSERVSGEPEEKETAASADAQAPAESEPADKAGSEAPPEKSASESDTSGTATKADPWDEMTPEQQRAAWQKLQASERSQRGRVGALTKKLNQVTAQTAPPSKPAKEETTEGAEGEEPPTAADLEARLDQVADTYSDVNGPVVEAIKDIRAEIAKLRPAVEQVALDKDAAEIAEARGALEAKHPDVAEIEADPEFVKWAEGQPLQVQQLLGSYDPNEVSLGLTLYKAERKSTDDAAAPEEEGQQGSTATDDKRRRQLDGSKQVAHGRQPAATGTPTDFGGAFKARVARTANA
jgi:hypothetical protein